MTRFSVISFSPEPEHVEFVHVALLFSTHWPGLVYDPTFPRLRCITPKFDADLLSQYLHTVASEVGQADDFAKLHSSVSGACSQFRASAPREIAAELTLPRVERLKQTFLAHAPRKWGERETVARIGRPIDTHLLKVIGLDDPRILRRAKPRKFLSQEVLARMGSNGFSVPRVVSGDQHLVLIDGIDLSWRRPHVERHAYQVTYAFGRMRELAGAIERFEHRKLHLAALVLGDDDDQHKRHGLDLVKRYASIVNVGEEPSQEMRDLLRSAAPSMLPG